MDPTGAQFDGAWARAGSVPDSKICSRNPAGCSPRSGQQGNAGPKPTPEQAHGRPPPSLVRPGAALDGAPTFTPPSLANGAGCRPFAQEIWQVLGQGSCLFLRVLFGSSEHRGTP